MIGRGRDGWRGGPRSSNGGGKSASANKRNEREYLEEFSRPKEEVVFEVIFAQLIPGPPPAPPWYQDPAWYAVGVAFLAIVLSQVPPARQWRKKRSIIVEVYPHLLVTHHIGNPNAGIHVSIENTGSREVKIRGLTLEIRRDGKAPFLLPIVNYEDEEKNSAKLLFTPTRIAPGKEWSHVAGCFQRWKRDDEKFLRDAESNLRRNIDKKLSMKKAFNQIRAKVIDVPVKDNALVEADPEVLVPVMEFFENNFVWEAGEYELCVVVKCDECKDVRERFTFNIFESESEELRNMSEEYKYGAWILYNPQTSRGPGISVELRPK